MCQSPITSPEGNVFACRRCDQCISARRFDWVARGMAERSTSAHTLSLTLTYGDQTQESRDGALMFRYSDIQAFMNRIRSAIWRKYKIRDAVRYICAGEQGDRLGRCHWHIILFSQIDLTTIGVVEGLYGPYSVREDFVTGKNQRPRRVQWSLWPFGFVSFQEADEGAMHYALSYALKDQFTAERSRGTNREHKVETFATGMFRMSKQPPIGTQYILNELERLANERCVLPDTNLKISDMKGYWWPRGNCREILLTGLKEINDQIRTERGRNAPQWSSLIHSCRESETDLELLGHGQEEPETFEDIAREIRARAEYDLDLYRRSQTAKQCGSSVACSLCLRGRSHRERELYGIEERYNAQGETFYAFVENDPEGSRLAEAQADCKGSGINVLCYNREAPSVVAAFPNSSRKTAPKAEGV